MKTKTYHRYSYADLRAAATGADAQQIDIDTLGAWFESFGETLWNGEYYDAGDDLRLFPIMEWDEDRDQGEVIRYEFR